MLGRVKLGKNGPMISRMGFGCMGMSGDYEADRNDNESIITIQTALKAGVNFFDTADVYGNGHSENLLGNALAESLKRNRKSIVIATKCGFVPTSGGGFYIDASPEHIKKSCENSLTRLKIDYIDIYYLHRLPAGGKEVLQKSLDALILLLQAGKIKHVGLSEADAESIRFTHQYLKSKGFPDAFVAVQSEFSIFVQEPLKNNVLATCRELGLSFIPFSPLCRGMLTEKMHTEIKFDKGDFRLELPMFQGENFKANLTIRDKLVKFSESKGCTLPQLGLAWLLSQNGNVVPIPGTKYVTNLMNNLKALNIHLTSEDLKLIQQIIMPGAVQGLRYPSHMFKLQNIRPAADPEFFAPQIQSKL